MKERRKKINAFSNRFDDLQTLRFILNDFDVKKIEWSGNWTGRNWTSLNFNATNKTLNDIKEYIKETYVMNNESFLFNRISFEIA